MKHRIILPIGIIAAVSLSTVLLGRHVAAQQDIELKIDPDVQEIVISGEIEEVSITVKNAPQDTQYLWEIDGKGKLDGDNTSPAMFYLPPSTLMSDLSQVSIKYLTKIIFIILC